MEEGLPLLSCQKHHCVRQAISMWIGWSEFDILLGDVRSLKAKRSVVRPLVAEVRKRFLISVAEVGDAALYRRTRLGVSMVSGDRSQIEETLTRGKKCSQGDPRLNCCPPKCDLCNRRTSEVSCLIKNAAIGDSKVAPGLSKHQANKLEHISRS